MRNTNEYDDTEAFLNSTKGSAFDQTSVNTNNDAAPIVEIGNEKDSSAAPKKLSCSPIPFAAFMLLGAIWGSAFLFIRFGVDPKKGFPPVSLTYFIFQQWRTF